jgi:hypothetical protein
MLGELGGCDLTEPRPFHVSLSQHSEEEEFQELVEPVSF